MIKMHYDYVFRTIFIDEIKANFINFLQFLLVDYLIDPCFIIFYRKKNFEILINFTLTRFLRQTRKITRKIAKFVNSQLFRLIRKLPKLRLK